MLKIIEIRKTYSKYPGMRAETLKRFEADDVRVQISGEEIIIFLDGEVNDIRGK